jgi:pyruvate dehydrogenase E2 component (dihydrolipoamide acetyltransferase)
MATPVIMPKAGMSMESGTIVRWLKQVGDDVQAGEPLLEITTDKVDMEVEAEASGCLLAVLHQAGTLVPVTQPIAYIGSRQELGKPAAELPAAPVGAAAADAPGEPPAPPRRVAATPAARRRAAELGLDLALPRPTGPQGEVRLRDVLAAAQAPRVRASPLIRQLAAREGVDLAGVQGSGPGGRILRGDLSPAPAAPLAAAEPAPGATQPRAQSERIPVSGKRKVIAERLSRSMFTAPHYYLKLAADVGALLAARSAAARDGRKPSLNAFLMKYAAEALKRHPAINSSWQDGAMVRFGSIDIGLAVAQPDGLITPVVRDCGNKGVLAIEAELQPLIERALAGRLRPDEYSDATFTISNLGAFGVDEFTAVINPPGSAILAVGAIRREPVVDDAGGFAAKTLVRLTLSCDHRVIDGAVGAAFLRFLGDILEDPARLLL